MKKKVFFLLLSLIILFSFDGVPAQASSHISSLQWGRKSGFVMTNLNALDWFDLHTGTATLDPAKGDFILFAEDFTLYGAPWVTIPETEFGGTLKEPTSNFSDKPAKLVLNKPLLIMLSDKKSYAQIMFTKFQSDKAEGVFVLSKEAEQPAENIGNSDNTGNTGNTNVNNSTTISVNVTVNGQPLEFKENEKPYTKNGRTMMPLRKLAEALGAQVEWDAENQTVYIADGDKLLEVPIGKQWAELNDKKISLKTPAELKGGRTFLPVRELSEALGAEVAWDANTNTASIKK